MIEANKSGIKFRNKKLESLNEDYSSVSDRYESQQSAIVAEMLGIAAGYSDIMNQLGLLVSKLDVIVSLALAAVSAPTQFVKPEMLAPTQPRRLDFSQLRHPIIELQVWNKFAFNHSEESCSTSKVSNRNMIIYSAINTGYTILFKCTTSVNEESRIFNGSGSGSGRIF